MIGVVVPAHDEEACIGACLESVLVAARHPGLHDEPVLVVVALDACTDGTERIADRYDVQTIAVTARNVGLARAIGADVALAAGARWLACTDADSTVAADWLVTQLALDSDVVCGTVAVRDWGSFSTAMRERYDAAYYDADGHRHIHGANLGISARAYRQAGGFQALHSSEDVALVNALRDSGASIRWSAAPRVFTSARRSFRAPSGFGAALVRIEAEARSALAALGGGLGGAA